ncbi:ANL_HP_G0201640.mRNA.1.CDS.1 [Saccharomyces cerevisiae]|nr:ANL_HP_G0201640.mRNA.1.CDS.1 [Saccharomyces cerevisiae]CAI6476452.1 ANL_HP_G0201640.mRNA.1.CDS.1 [Saccharomyces cerevisiae]
MKISNLIAENSQLKNKIEDNDCHSPYRKKTMRSRLLKILLKCREKDQGYKTKDEQIKGPLPNLKLQEDEISSLKSIIDRYKKISTN